MPVAPAPERLVNTVTDGVQRSGDVAAGARQIATTWLDESSGSAVAKLRLYDLLGVPVGGEITVGAATDVAVTTFGDGFVVVRTVQVGPQQVDVVAQTYSTAGVATGAPLILDTTDLRNTPTVGYRSSGLEITTLSDGGYIVGWSNDSGAFGQTSVSAEYVVVSAQGAIEGRDTLASATGRVILGNIEPAFTELPNGQILATYLAPGVGLMGPGPAVSTQYARLLDLSGAALGPAVRIDANAPVDGAPPITSTNGLAVGGLPNGKVVFAWISQGSVYVSLVPAGQLDQAERSPAISLGTISGVGEPDVIVLRDGTFVVGWSGAEDVWAQRFSATGQPMGGQFKIGTVSLGLQDQLRLAVGPNNEVVALWQDPSGQFGAGGGADPSGLGVKLEVIALESGQTGGPGRDTLTGGEANDLLIGNAGDDVLTGRGGADTLLGGGGGDILDGGFGNDLIDGGSSGDFVTYAFVVGNPTGVTVDLETQTSTGRGGDDILRSVEHVYGSDYADNLRGNHLSNLLSGGAGDDVIEGQAGSNYIDGGAGNDLLVLVGSVTDYFVTARAGQPALVSGPFGVDQVLNIERVRVGTTEMSWSDFTSQAFNGLRYVASNPSLIASIGADAERAKQHWLSTGQAQGLSLDAFDPLRYAASNPDLQAQYYIDTAALTRHYIQTGFAQGRPTNTFDALQYGAANNDLLLAYGADAAALTRHYVVSGVAEHRPVNGFDPLAYGAANDDLARVFGTDSAGLFSHWINSGVYEGRETSGFDPVAYLLGNHDLAGLVTVQTAREHWLTVGADQGRRGDELFGREQTNHELLATTRGELRNFTTSGRFVTDQDWFEVRLNGVDTYRFTVQGADSGHGTLTDPHLEIYDARGFLVAYDNDSGIGRDATVEFRGTQGGPVSNFATYYVVVRGASGEEGTYDVSYGLARLGASSDEGWVA